MMQQEALLNEIRQIANQYNNEVPGRRKSWPNAIKQRVKELGSLGMSYKAISDQTGLPYFTVLSWSKVAGEFKEVVTVTVPTQSPKTLSFAGSTATVTVTTPSGFRIEGISFEQVLSILERLK